MSSQAALASIPFNLGQDLPLLRAHRLNGSNSNDSVTSYDINFEKSRELSSSLLKDPKQIASIEDLIALPNFAELVKELMSLEMSETKNWLSALGECVCKSPKLSIDAPEARPVKILADGIADLTSLISQTLVPVIEDYISLGKSKNEADRASYFRKLLLAGINLNDDTRFSIQKNQKRDGYTFNIEQGKNSMLIIEPRKFGLVFRFVNKANKEEIVLNANLQNQKFDFSVVGSGINPAPIYFIDFNDLTQDSIKELKSIIENEIKTT